MGAPSYRWHVLALGLALLHHVDHGVRGTHIGWPLTPDVNTFTYSLAIYPVVGLGFAVRRARYWLAAASGGLALLSGVHVLVETPGEIVAGYAAPFGVVALAVLLGLIAVLAWLTWRYARLATSRSLQPPPTDARP